MKLNDSLGNSVDCRVIRVSSVGEVGYELHCAPADAVLLYEMLIYIGQELNIQNVGYRALEALTLEAGVTHNGYFLIINFLIVNFLFDIF